MKRYVYGYWTRDEKEPRSPRAPFERDEPTDVGYAATPEWRIETREVADYQCSKLRQMRVHVGEHYCEFEVEKLSEGDFAVVCASHPDHLKVARPAS